MIKILFVILKSLIIFLSATLLFVILIFFNLDKLDVTQSATKSDLLLCLGGGTGERILKSIKLYEQNFVQYNIIISDTKNKDVDKKAEIAENLIKNKKFIIKKYQTRNTLDELLFSEEILKKYNYKSIIIVSDEPHSKRIKILIDNFTKFNELNIRYTIVGSEVYWWNKKYFYSNRKAVSFSMQEFFKIIHNYVLYNLIKYSIITQEELNNLNKNKHSMTKMINSVINNIYNLSISLSIYFH